MGASKGPPDPITPGEAAKAAVGTAGAGEMMAIANQPIEQYSNLATNIALGPAQIRAQQALANQAALQGAQAQRDIQSQVDPYAFAQREMRLKQATNRLGQLYGENPANVSYRAPDAYAMPGSIPAISDIRKQGAAIASNLSTAAVDKGGGFPQIVRPSKPEDYAPIYGYG
jgi:hypothetical protein